MFCSGYHVYFKIWKAVPEETLSYRRESIDVAAIKEMFKATHIVIYNNKISKTMGTA